MEHSKNKQALLSGASFAGLSTAYWMNKAGYKVTVVEIGGGLKKGGTPVNIVGNCVDIVKRMGLYEQVQANKIVMEVMEFKNANDVTERSDNIQKGKEQPAGEEYEIERDVLLHLLYDSVKEDVQFIFGDSVTAMKEEADGVAVTFGSGQQRSFDVVFGCDGIHSAVRKLWFGEESEFSHFLKTYFSITIVNKLLIKENTIQMYNEPGRMIMINAYNNKTDIVLCFHSEQEIPYDYRDEKQQRDIVANAYSGTGWRAAELLEELKRSETFYFDKLCQVKMPSWTKGRVALVGDAGYCASPAAGRGGSLALDGAAALNDALIKCNGDIDLAFLEYNKSFRPFIEEIQAYVVNVGVDMLIPLTQEAINARMAQKDLW